MNKILLALAALIFALAGLVYKFSLDQPLGRAALTASETATTTGRMYSHEAAGTRTATATLQIIDIPAAVDSLGVTLTIQNATNTPGKIFIVPEGTWDSNWGWSNLASFHVSNGAAGAFVNDVDLGNGSTTQLTFTPTSQGTTSVAYTFKKPAGIRQIRFRVWGTGTTSIALDIFKLIK